MRFPTVLAPALFVPAALVAVPLQQVAADVRAGSAYETYVACSTKKSAPASHSCGKNQPKTAFFKPKDADVTYKICVKYPGGQKLCANNQDAKQGEKSKNPITSTKTGQHKVKWYVDGEKVGTFAFQVRSSRALAR